MLPKDLPGNKENILEPLQYASILALYRILDPHHWKGENVLDSIVNCPMADLAVV